MVTNVEDKLMEDNEYYKRANFFPGLKATPGFWNGMEEYHFRKETLYNSLFHGSGIVPEYRQSLNVQAEKLLLSCSLWLSLRQRKRSTRRNKMRDTSPRFFCRHA